jgi:hypothetical protein
VKIKKKILYIWIIDGNFSEFPFVYTSRKSL